MASTMPVASRPSKGFIMAQGSYFDLGGDLPACARG